MVSTEEVYTSVQSSVQSSGCLWVMTKIVVAFLILMIFFLGLFAGIVLSSVFNTLM